MKKIKQFIDKELQVYKSKKSLPIVTRKSKKINWEKELLISEYNKWIKNLYMSMHSSKFRQVLTEIETNKKKFDEIPEYHWRYQIVQMRAIFRIIQKKLNKYRLILGKDNCYQNRSVLFWFNQSVLILEQLNLKFRYDLNNNNLTNENIQDIKIIIRPIQSIYKGYIELLYLLIKYAYIRREYQEIFAYLSMADGLSNYASHIVNINSMPKLQRILLIRAKVYLANCDYLNATKYIKKSIDLCTDQINYIVDYRLNLEIIDKSRNDILDYSLSMDKCKVKTLQNVLINIILDFYLRGVLSELIGSTTGAIDSYKQSKFFATKFLKNKFYNFTMFFYHLQNNGMKYLAVMEEFQKFKEEEEMKTKKYNEMISRKKKLKRLKYQRNYNKYYSKIRVNHNLYKGVLKAFLDKVAIKTIKEEENRQGILTKFKKSKFITSTIELINIMLSKDFTGSLKKMKSIEISKYPKEVNEFINSNYYKHNKLLDEENINEMNKSKINNKSQSRSNNRSKDLILNESPKITKDNSGFNSTTKNFTTKNNQNNFNNYNLYNFNQSKNTLNNRYMMIFKNNNTTKIEGSSKSLLNEKRLTNDSSYTTKKLKKNVNQSDISIINSLDNDNTLINYKKNPNTTKHIFYKKNNNSSLISNYINQKKKDLSFIDSKSISKNNSIKYSPSKQSPVVTTKIYKIKINKSKAQKRKKNVYRINRDYFDKTLHKKKDYLDKFCVEEIKFHRKLLKTKSCEIEQYKEEHFDYDSKKPQLEADLAYDRIYELCKSSIGKKSFDNFFKNIRMVQSIQNGSNKEEEKTKLKQKNSQEYNTGNESFDINTLYINNNWDTIGKNYIIKNNEKKIHLLDMEYDILNHRENELKSYRKKILY